MSYNFASASSQHLSTASAPVTAEPFTLACWVRLSSITTMRVIALNGANGVRHQLSVGISDSGASAQSINGGNSGTSSSGNYVGTTNEWHHRAAVFDSSTSRTAYYNGTAGSTNTTNISITGINQITIGAGNNPAGTFVNGRIAEVGVWNVALNAAEIGSLADGMTCDKVRPDSLVFYAPLVRDLIDYSGGLTITNNNTATVAEHPRVYA